MTDFSALLVEAIAASGQSLRAFAKVAAISPAHVSNIANGRYPPPLDALDRWADALGLTGKARSRFILDGQLAHCPEEVRAYVARLERRCGMT